MWWTFVFFEWGFWFTFEAFLGKGGAGVVLHQRKVLGRFVRLPSSINQTELTKNNHRKNRVTKKNKKKKKTIQNEIHKTKDISTRDTVVVGFAKNEENEIEEPVRGKRINSVRKKKLGNGVPHEQKLVKTDRKQKWNNSTRSTQLPSIRHTTATKLLELIPHWDEPVCVTMAGYHERPRNTWYEPRKTH